VVALVEEVAQAAGELAARVRVEDLERGEEPAAAERDRVAEPGREAEPVVARAAGEAMQTHPENGEPPRQCCATP